MQSVWRKLIASQNPGHIPWDSCPTLLFRTVLASGGMQYAKPLWYRHFGDLSAKPETILDGCRGSMRRLLRRFTNHGGSGYEAVQTFVSGCDPRNCLGLCDKSMLGICVAGHVGRFAVCQFGHKVLNGLLTNAVCASCPRSTKWTHRRSSRIL